MAGCPTSYSAMSPKKMNSMIDVWSVDSTASLYLTIKTIKFIGIFVKQDGLHSIMFLKNMEYLGSAVLLGHLVHL